MKTTYSDPAVFTQHASAAAEYAALAAGRDFSTPDGRLVPRALGEAGLRQRTAMLIGGMLIGNWPEHL
ncbi:hypothetical protein HHL22_19610 [Hymenobacter sp. RP-2-7]|uniref:Uncharacterized protein n=1 Tax=Hymenobacter polaris TaxID=2682546 RepID=A0A7Y0AHF0_9BACT|nr:hypothetical protein [Hymenobacter polaris]NML67416.1 hypothetical protein [Hymenobacter polaris]